MNKDTKELNHKRLSIQLSSDGFSFCTYDDELKLYENFVHVSFPASYSTPSVLLNEVKHIFETHELLHQNYDEVLLIHHNSLNTFVPLTHFDEGLLHNYLEYTVKTFENDFVSFDEVKTIEANNVYIPFVNINNFIFDSFGAFTYLHSSTVFLENILKSYDVTEKTMFVNVYHQNFQVLVLEQHQLILSNSFSYQTKEDFAYYILFVAEQLKMNPNEFNLWMFGDIKEEDETYQLIYNYVRNVSVYSKLNSRLSANISFLPQQHFNLLQLHL
ncbi:DUF3822 family protein [Wenyingzhuangia sp. IMCC45533]